MSKSLKPTWTRYKVLAWLGGAATIAYICRNSIGVAEIEIRADLGLDAFQMGLVMGAFQISYALLQIPTGHFTDRHGARKSLPVFSVIWSLATAAMAAVSSLWLLLAARLANGVGRPVCFRAARTHLQNGFLSANARWSMGASLVS